MEQTYTLTLTENCNLACVYCYEHNRNGRRMAFETAKTILDHAFCDVGENDLLTVDFFGGEPFLEFETIQKIVHYVIESSEVGRLKSKYRFFATTNGTLVHDEIKDWVAQYPFFHLGLSLDGTREMHNKNRCNSFDRIDLPFFARKCPSQQIKMTISNETLPQLAEGVIFCHEQGFEVSCNLAYGIDWSKPYYLDYLEQQTNILIEYYLAHPNIQPCSLLNRNLTMVKEPENDSTVRAYCGTGTVMHTFDCDGKAYPCQFFMPISCGVEKSKKAKEIRFVKEIPVSCLDEKCQNCIIRDVCPTCYGSNYVESGNIYHKTDSQCALEKKTFYQNACFQILRWEAGQLSKVAEEELVATLKGAKTIIEKFGSL